MFRNLVRFRHLNILKKEAEYVVKKCIKTNKKLSFAESCTGGLLSSLITSVPNSSKIFNSSFVTYSNLSKQNILNVDQG